MVEINDKCFKLLIPYTVDVYRHKITHIYTTNVQLFNLPTSLIHSKLRRVPVCRQESHARKFFPWKISLLSLRIGDSEKPIANSGLTDYVTESFLAKVMNFSLLFITEC